MKNVTNQSLSATSVAHNLPTYYPPLDTVTRPTLSTAETAFYIHVAKQTLLSWSSTQMGPLQPVKIRARLHWNTNAVRALLSGGAL